MLLGGPGLTLLKAKLRHAPVYSVLPLPHFLCLTIGQQEGGKMAFLACDYGEDDF